jgi:hypothetical protein
MQTTIKSVDIEWVGSGAKKYGKAAVKHDNGKGERTQYLVSFKNPDVFKKVQELIGQTVEVENVKNGDFWEWKSIGTAGAVSSSSSVSAATPSATRVSGSNYETKEERAARQVLIVKQSSLGHAIELLTTGAKTPPSTLDVIDLAQDLTDWVFGNKEDDGSIEAMSDDVPF